MIFMARWKVITNLIVCLLGILFALPNILSPEQAKQLPSWFQHKINLGLELRGGSHLQFEVDLKAVKKDMLTTLVDDIRAVLRKEQIGYVGLTLNPQQSSITFTLRDAQQRDKVLKILKTLDHNLQVTIGSDGETSLQYTEAYLEQRLSAIIEQSKEVIRRRIDESGTKEPNILRQGNDRIIVQLPGIDDPAEVKKLIGKTAKLSFRLVDNNSIDSSSGTPNSQVALGSEILPETRADGKTTNLAIKKQVMVSGETLIDAQATTDQNNQPAVSLRFNAIGARKFADMSANHLKKQFAIVLDNVVISAPVFQEVIPSGQGQISGHFTFKEANDLALLLRAGALPAPLKIIEERTVGPSLGADSIHDGLIATTLAIVLVGIFMILNYSLFGIFADIALIFNLIFLFAALGVLQATLTLPGIAGIALTVGMAVDSNVLIYERIKEELRHGAKIFSAIEAGYRRAVTTIIDSNLTTLIGAAVLFEFGTGPIRGFAVTLALGILISMFTTLALNRMIISYWLRKKRPTTLPI
jgi:preprotein translocase subunit SecD